MRQFDATSCGTVGVAVSGGVDSMCLLHYMVQGGATVVALTVEHGIRGAESRLDADLVQRYCQTLGVPCVRRDVDAVVYAEKHHIGLEQAARALRHAFFAEMLRDGKVDCIATAHHLDDQCETVLFNLFRGTGLRGMAGIAHTDRYIRPFLGWTRAQIVQYAHENSVPFRDDSTNGDTLYSRNYLRHEILPKVEARFPAYRQSVDRFAHTVKEHIDLLDSLTPAPHVEDEVVYLPVSALSLHPALAKWSAMRALRLFDGGVDQFAPHVEEVVGLASGRVGGKVNLPHGVCAALEYDNIAFWRENAGEPNVAYPFGEGAFVFGATYVVRPWQQGDALRFDMDKVPAGSVIRLRRPGDAIAKFGGGTKSLGDYFTDKKVPLRVRDSYPVVACEQQILVCVADISRHVAVDERTQRIYTLIKME